MTAKTAQTSITATPRSRVPELWLVKRISGRVAIYALLIAGASFMFFPMIWMITASLKPEWQILTEPISIPSQWIHVQAGNTTQEIPVWYATDPNGERDQVLKIGTRRYTTVIDSAQLSSLLAVPADTLGVATPTEIDGLIFNVRQWTDPDGETQEVVALARDGDNMVVFPVELLIAASSRMALADVNAGSRARIDIEGYTFQARELEEEGLIVIPIGPETELTIVAPKAIAEQAILVAADAPIDPEFVPIGNTELQHYLLADGPADEYYIVQSSETWQPVIDLDVIHDYGLVVNNLQLSDETEIRKFKLAPLPVATLTQDAAGPLEVVVLLETTERSLVVPIEHSETIRLAPISRLTEPFVDSIERMAVRYRDDYTELGERYTVAIVGERVDMSLVVPETAITEAFDVPSDLLKSVRRIRFHLENFVDTLELDVGGATFFTFYRNSGLLVILNLAGHFISVTLVAYGFARLNAPGKRVLFVILLSTMMLPWPVMLIPQFEIFQKLGMINTLWPLFIRAFFGNAFLIFLLRQFFMGIPLELEDAARIDGASTLQILWHVMLPLSKPALATIGVFTFWWTWNSYLEPLVYLSSVKHFTVSLGLGFFKSQYAYNFRFVMAASIIAIMPIILIFFFAQRYFIEGIQLTGLKG